MKGKRFFGLAAALLMLPQLPVVTEPYGTVTVSAYTERGRCGENAYFTLDMNSGLLTIEGEGRIDDAAEYESAWNAWHRNIRNVVISDGITEIEHIEYIERGYEAIDEKFRKLGADIQRVYRPDAESVAMSG